MATGRPIIKRRLKRAHKRVLKINQESKSILENLILQSNAATYSASPGTPTRSCSPGYSNRKWAVSGKSLPVIRLDSIRTLDFTLCATRF